MRWKFLKILLHRYTFIRAPPERFGIDQTIGASMQTMPVACNWHDQTWKCTLFIAQTKLFPLSRIQLYVDTKCFSNLCCTPSQHIPRRWGLENIIFPFTIRLSLPLQIKSRNIPWDDGSSQDSLTVLHDQLHLLHRSARALTFSDARNNKNIILYFLLCFTSDFS